MKKTLKIFIISISISLLIAGAVFAAFYFSRPKNTNLSLDWEDDNSELTTEISDKNIADCSPMESLIRLEKNLSETSSYYATVAGEVDAGGIYKQSVSGEKYKSGDSSLYVSRSTSALKNTAYQFFIHKDAVFVRKGNAKTDVYENSVTGYTLKEFLKEYGTDFRALSNYKLNDNTIIKAELISVDRGQYTYRYEINVENGVNGYKVNMAKMGDLGEYPNFSKSTLEVVMTEDFMPVSVTHSDEYSAKFFVFSFNCKSTLVEKFEKINDQTIVVRDHEFFAAQLSN